MNAPVDLAPPAEHRAIYAAEQDVLAGCVRNPERIGRLTLEPKHFHAGPHRELWECLLALHAEGEIIDTIAIAERCEQIGKFQNYTYLGELLVNSPDSNFDFKANLIYRRSQQVDLWRQIERCLHTRDEALIVAAAEAIQTRTALGARRAVQADMDTAYQSMVDEWAAARERPKLLFGLRDLDRAIKPMQPTRLYVAAGRPGMGKTAFGLNIAISNARAGRKVGFISVEQPMEELTARALCIMAHAPADWINGSAQVPPNDVRRIDQARKELRDLPMMINDATPMTIGELKVWARSLVHRHGCELLVVDYLQKVTSPAKEFHRAVAEVAMGLKDIARQLKVPVLALAQAKRDAQGRRPTMSDLGDSGVIEREADVIMALYRKDQLSDDDEGDRKEPEGMTEILVLKNRDGESDLRVKTIYQGECYRFNDYEWRYAR